MVARIVAVGLVAVVAAAPWAFGAVQARVQFWLALPVLALLSVHLVLVLGGARRARLPLVALPLAVGIALGVFQLVPWAPALARWVAPYASTVQAQFGSPARVDARSAADHPITRSVYPPGTRTQLALLALATATFLIAAAHAAQGNVMRMSVIAIALVGTALAVFALAQKIAWNGLVYWQIPLSHGGQPFGPFVNRNNAAGFLNICMAAGLATLILASPFGDTTDGRQRSGQHHASARNPLERFVDALQTWLGQLGARQLLALSLLVFIGAAIVASASRGGLLSLVVAVTVTSGCLTLKRENRTVGVALGVFLLAALGVVVWLGQSADTQARLERLAAEQSLLESDARFFNWQEAIKSVPSAIMLGHGLDTYRFVYTDHHLPRFTGDTVHYHAENQFVQALVDGGLVAFAALCLAIGLVLYAAGRLIRSNLRSDLAIGAMGVYAVTSQLVAGSFDFGLYVPANALAMALVCGIVVGRAAHRFRESSRRQWLGMELPAGVAGALVGVLLVIVGLGAIELRRAGRVEDVLSVASVQRVAEQRSGDELKQWMLELERALRERWDDGEGHQRMCQMWLQQYRLGTAVALQFSPEIQSEADRANAWERATVWQTAATYRELTARGQSAAADQLLHTRPAEQCLAPAWESALLARRYCPLLPQAHFALAELCGLVGDEPELERHLARATQLAPGDAALWYWRGVHHWYAAEFPEAVDAWHVAMTLTRQFDAPIADRLEGSDEAASLVMRLAPDEPGRWMDLAEAYWSLDERGEVYRQLCAEVVAGTENTSDGEQWFARARALWQLERYDESLVAYRAAVEADRFNHEWQYRLGAALYERGMYDEALEAARRCAASGDKPKYEELLKKVMGAAVRG
jgi:O-antigen ligase/tetratricopeptide (TPR) repeat protein